MLTPPPEVSRRTYTRLLYSLYVRQSSLNKTQKFLIIQKFITYILLTSFLQKKKWKNCTVFQTYKTEYLGEKFTWHCKLEWVRITILSSQKNTEMPLSYISDYLLGLKSNQGQKGKTNIFSRKSVHKTSRQKIKQRFNIRSCGHNLSPCNDELKTCH